MNEQHTTQAQDLGDETFMSVADLKAYVAQVEAAKASESYAAIEQADQARRVLIEKLMKPIDFTPEKAHAFLERLRLAATRGDTQLRSPAFRPKCARTMAARSTMPRTDGPTLWSAPPAACTKSGETS